MGPSINDVGNWDGGGVKNWSKLSADSIKKLPTWGRGCQKSGKIADVVYGWSLTSALSPQLLLADAPGDEAREPSARDAP